MTTGDHGNSDLITETTEHYVYMKIFKVALTFR